MIWNVLTLFAAEAGHAAEAASHAEETGGLATFGIDPLTIALQSGTFLILFILIRKYALGKIVHTLDERRNIINRSLQTAEDLEVEREKLEKKIAKQLATARADASQIIADAQKEASAIVASAEGDATKRAASIVERAEKQAAAQYQQLHAQLKGELLGLVSDATEYVTQQKLDAKTDAKLLEEALAKVEA